MRIEPKISKDWYAGLIFDYWNARDPNFPSGINNITYERSYSSYGITLFIEKKNKFKSINFNYGFGIGRYVIENSFYGGNDSEGYLSLCFLTGIDLLFNKNFMASLEISYYSMFNFDKTNRIINFKIGPSIIF